MATPNQLTAYAFFRAKGLSPVAASGIVGNLTQESNVNPGEAGGGIAQWGGNRLANLQSYASATHSSPTALGTQLAFIWQELNSSYKPALQTIEASATPSAAALAFSNLYERPEGTANGATATTPNTNPVGNVAARQNYAQGIYDELQSLPSPLLGGESQLEKWGLTPAENKIVQLAGSAGLATFAAADVAGGLGAEDAAGGEAAGAGSAGGAGVGTLAAVIAGGGLAALLAWIGGNWLRILEFLGGVVLGVFGLVLVGRAGMKAA